MIRLFKTHYLKSRAITLSCKYSLQTEFLIYTDYADKVMAEYVKKGLENPTEKFLEEDPMKFHV